MANIITKHMQPFLDTINCVYYNKPIIILFYNKLQIKITHFCNTKSLFTILKYIYK